MEEPYHEGELAVQTLTGTRDQAQRMSRSIHAGLPTPLTRFLATQRWMILGAADGTGDVWASFLTGEPGFVHTVEDRTIKVAGHPHDADPLHDIGLGVDATQVGALVIDFDRRMRARINGLLYRDDSELRIDVEQAYSNCMKYIQRREVTGTSAAAQVLRRSTADRLTARHAAWVRRADTAFIATATASRGADASHRGGAPGFLQCSADGRHVEFIDYRGNGMFNTLGNLVLDERAGLTVPDFETGAVLAMTGRARLKGGYVASEEARSVVFSVRRVVELAGALPFTFGPVEYSPFLPSAASSARPIA